MTNHMVPQATSSNSRIYYGYIIVVVAFLIMLTGYGIRTIFGVFFKPMLIEFEWTRAVISGAVTLSMVTQGIWGIVMGRLNDRIGPRLIISLCCFLLGLGFILMSLINHIWQIYLFYGIIIGFGMGGVFVVLLSITARWFAKRRGIMIGIVLTGIGMSSLVMSPVATSFISAYGWRLAYAIVGGMVLVIGIVLAQFLKRDPSVMNLKPYGQDELKIAEFATDKTGLSLYESIRTWQFWMLSLIFVCVGYCMFAITVHLVPHVTDLGITPAIAAFVLALTGAGNVIGGIFLGGIADRLGNKQVLAICLTLIALSIYLLIPISEVWMLYVVALIFGFGAGGGGVAEPTLVAELFGLKSHGSIFGVVSFSFTVGGAIGPLVTGYLFDISGNYETAFLVSGSIGVCGLILTLLLKPVHKQNTQTVPS